MRILAAGLGLALAAAAPVADAGLDPGIVAWAFPAAVMRPRPDGPDAGVPRRLPGSTVQRTDVELRDMGRAVDWFPAAHPLPPAAVAGAPGRKVAACGFCHLPGGEGRVENASLAGLPAPYIRAQVAAFADGTRAAAQPGWGPTAYMRQVAHDTDPAAVAAAATYFSRLRFAPRLRVVEAATIPALRPGNFILARAGDGEEPLGTRIVETPDDLAAFEARDPRVGYTAYVPPGSLARGRAVAERVGCSGCHGAGMTLWGAGRSPTYIVRQLLAFRTGARHDTEAGPMAAVAAQLSPDDMIAVAAYWGSLRP